MTRVCYETGNPLADGTKDTARFSSDAARTAWNNRIKSRGVEVYNLLMIWRFERPFAKRLKVISLLCRMIARRRAEDREANRVSYLPVEEVVAKVEGR